MPREVLECGDEGSAFPRGPGLPTTRKASAEGFAPPWYGKIGLFFVHSMQILFDKIKPSL